MDSVHSSSPRAQLDSRGIVVECAKCHRHNRLPYEHLTKRARCSQCQTALPPASTPIEVAAESHFDALVSRSALPVLVDFWAAWCGPCKMMAGEFAQAAAAGAGRWLSAKVDTDALVALAQRYRIQALPTLTVFKDGRVVASETGARPANAIRALAERFL